MKAADRFANPTTAPNQLWQPDFTYLKVHELLDAVFELSWQVVVVQQAIAA